MWGPSISPWLLAGQYRSWRRDLAIRTTPGLWVSPIVSAGRQQARSLAGPAWLIGRGASRANERAEARAVHLDLNGLARLLQSAWAGHAAGPDMDGNDPAWA